MNTEEVENKLKSYKREVQDFHPFLKNFLPQIPHIKHMEYTHGNREYWADFILIEEDAMLLKEAYVGIVVKIGKIKQSDIEIIERQINESFRMPKTIFNGKKKVNLNKIWLITNGIVTVNALDKIAEYFKQKNVEIIDLQMLARLIIRHYPNYLSELVDNVFTIDNNHIADSGKIPKLDTEGKYKGYYENMHGEQFIFLGDQKTGKAIVRGGDFGWETEIEIFTGMQGGKWIFSNEEILWISHCYSTMTGLKLEEVYKEFLFSLNPIDLF
ncbi:MAG: hypothetical protein AAGJ18_13895, partial [Bacteroidota bacterium]